MGSQPGLNREMLSKTRAFNSFIYEFLLQSLLEKDKQSGYIFPEMVFEFLTSEKDENEINK